MTMKKNLLSLLLLCTGFAFSQAVDLQSFADGFSNPTEIANAGDDRLFVVEKGGQIKVLNANGSVNAMPFLDISSIISAGGERGLLGLAFHPDYDTNSFFYVNYTNTTGDTVIARYMTSTVDPDVADPNSGTVLLTVVQPFSNHNGGCINFGTDGYLYISMGDGGSGGDPNDYAQNLDSLLGKMLRIDVDGNNAGMYGIPADNPFASTEGADEIWAYGLRNAWKFSFDKDNNDLWIADVGQSAIEEINKADPTLAGLDYGWRCYEGTSEFNLTDCNNAGTAVFPFAEYTHTATGGCSITGGYVYRGTDFINFEGMYFFADYCNNKIGMVDTNGNIDYTIAFSGEFFTTFGQDIDGELYIAGTGSGTVYRITDASLAVKEHTASAFTIYPNPAYDIITVQTDNTPVAAIAVYDISGKMLISKEYKAISSPTVNISALPQGLYMIMITDSNGTKHSHKLSVK